MAESLWLAVCPRRDSMAPLIVSRRVDDDGLSAFAAELGADPGIAEVWLYTLAAEKVVTFKGPIFLALVKEHQEREMFARLKAKFEPAAVVGVPGPVHCASAEVKPVVVVSPVVDNSDVDIAVDDVGIPFFEDRIAIPVESFYVVPAGKTAAEITDKVNADPVSPFAAYIVNDVVRLRQKERRIVGAPVAEAPPVAKAGPVPSYTVGPEGLVGPEFDANGDRVLHNGMKLPDRAGCIDGADYLAQLLRWFRPRLSMSAALTAAREARPIETFTPTETAIRVFADRASALDDALAAVQGLAREPATPEEPSPDGVAFLASMARGRRAALSEASCLAAARELYHKLGGYSTARAAEAIADRAALLEAGIPSASIVGGP